MVLEVGPGTGNMTVKLLEKAKKVMISHIYKIYPTVRYKKNAPLDRMLLPLKAEVLTFVIAL